MSSTCRSHAPRSEVGLHQHDSAGADDTLGSHLPVGLLCFIARNSCEAGIRCGWLVVLAAFNAAVAPSTVPVIVVIWVVAVEAVSTVVVGQAGGT